jgi:hypothetical protein
MTRRHDSDGDGMLGLMIVRKIHLATKVFGSRIRGGRCEKNIAGLEGWRCSGTACGIFSGRGGMCGDKDGRAWERAWEET